MKDFKKSSNSLETRRIRKILNEEARLGISPNSDSDSEEVNLQKELYPLGHYINNREEMIEQMFSIIKGAKLKKMLPPILKDMPLDELKADCLIHLLGLSKKRIRAILEGREINSSSDSESQSDFSTTSKKNKVDLKPFVIKQEGCSDISDNSEEVVLVDPDLEFSNLAKTDGQKQKFEGRKKTKRKLKKKELDKKHKRIKSSVVENSGSDEVLQIDSSVGSASDNEIEEEAPKEGKTLLEILELEMRARAIRALLKNNEPQDNEELQNTTDNTNPENPEKSKKHSKEEASKKITPAKHFRKKKRKSDDVIVIAPKVVTIDLTDENEQTATKNNREEPRGKNTRSNEININLDNKSQEISVSEKLKENKGGKQNSISDSIVGDEELSKVKYQVNTKVVMSCSEKDSFKNSLDESVPQEHDKSNWAQRWLESKEVKKVVSTSKICGNIRKKIKSAKLALKQTSSQELTKPSQAAQKEIEGSVVEYELLSKIKTVISSKGDGRDDGTQASTLTANLEPTSESLAVETTAEQVQDISSTKAENNSTGVVQVNKTEHQITDEEALMMNTEYDTNDSVTVTTNNYEETNLPSTTVEVEKLKDNDGNIVDKNICCEEETATTLLNHSDKSFDERIEVEKDHPKLLYEPPLVIRDSEVLDSKMINNECYNLSTTNESAKRENGSKFGSPSLLADHGDIKGVNDIEHEYNSNKKNDLQEVEVNKDILDSEPKIIHREIRFSEASMLKNAKIEKPAQELHEPETLEITITDEDREIENAIDEKNEHECPDVEDVVICID